MRSRRTLKAEPVVYTWVNCATEALYLGIPVWICSHGVKQVRERSGEPCTV